MKKILFLFTFLFVVSSANAQYLLYTEQELLEAMQGTRDIRFNTYLHKDGGVTQPLKGISVDSLFAVVEDLVDSISLDLLIGEYTAYVSPTGSDTGVLNSLKHTWNDPWKAAEYLQGLGLRKGKVHIYPGRYKLGDVGCTDCTSTYVSTTESHLWKLPETYIHLESGAILIDSVITGENSVFWQTSLVEDTSFLYVTGNGRFYKYTNKEGTNNGTRGFMNRDGTNLPKVGVCHIEADYIQCGGYLANCKKLRSFIFNVKELNQYNALGIQLVNEMVNATDTLFAVINIENVVHNYRELGDSIKVSLGTTNDFHLIRLGFTIPTVANVDIKNYRGVQSQANGMILGGTGANMANLLLNLKIGNAKSDYVGTSPVTDYTADIIGYTATDDAPMFSFTQTMTNSNITIDCGNCHNKGSNFGFYNIGAGVTINITGNYISSNAYNLVFHRTASTTAKVYVDGNFRSFRPNAIYYYTVGNAQPSWTSQTWLKGSYYCTQSGVPNITTRATDVINLEFAKLITTGTTPSITTDYGIARNINVIGSYANNLPNLTAPNNIVEIGQGLYIHSNIK